MNPCIQRFHRHATTADVVSAIREHGVTIIENLYAPEVMDVLIAKVTHTLDQKEPGGGEWFGNSKRSVGALFSRGVEFSEHLLENERILELADAILLPQCPMAASAPKKPQGEAVGTDFRVTRFQIPDTSLGPNCHHYRINATVAMQVCRGGTNQALHRDEWRYLPYMQIEPGGPEPTLAIMVAATEFTSDNGATRFVPGSHHWARDREPAEHEVVQAVMAKGSAAFWLGSVFHGLGTSQVTEPRTGMLYSYVVDRFTQEENQFLAVPPEIARTLSPRAQQLLGYRSSETLNWVEGLDQDHMLNTGKSGPL